MLVKHADMQAVEFSSAVMFSSESRKLLLVADMKTFYIPKNSFVSEVAETDYKRAPVIPHTFIPEDPDCKIYF